MLENYLEGVSRVLSAQCIAIYLLDADTGRPTRIASRGVSKRFLDLYEQYGRGCDPLLRYVIHNAEPVHDGILYAGGEWRYHPVREVLSTERMESVLEAPLLGRHAVVGTLNFARTPTLPTFDDDDLVMIERMSQHTSQALTHALALSEAGRRQRVAEAMLQAAGMGVILTDGRGNVHYANLSAERLLDRCEANQALKGCVSGAVQANLGELAGAAVETTRSIYLPTRSIGRHAYLSLRSVRMPVETEMIVTFLYEPGEVPDFQHLSGVLTYREIQVLELLAQGLDNKQIASRLTLSINTVKSHLKRMSAKLEVSSRSQLLSRAFFVDSGGGTARRTPCAKPPVSPVISRAEASRSPGSPGSR
jgi:DNA-binding CsgD family transcriptional regulator/PAS domain-containing protein